MQYLKAPALCLILAFSAPLSAEPLKDFSFKDLDGKALTLSDYHGKWVVANYWATWCPPCRVEIPDLIRFSKERTDAVVLGMDVGEDTPEKLREFIKELDINYPIIPTQNSTMYGFGEVLGVPATFIVNPDGELVGQHSGILNYDQLTAMASPDRKQNKYETGTEPSADKSLWQRFLDLF